MPQQSILTNSDVRVDPRSGAPTKVRGDFPLGQAGIAVAAADTKDNVKTFIKDSAGDLKLDAPNSDFELIQDVTTPARRVLRYQQKIAGIPVLDGVVIVQLSHENVVKQVDIQQPGVNQVPIQAADAQLTPDAAMQTAIQKLGSPELRIAAVGPETVYFPSDTGLKLAYKIIIPTKNPVHDWLLVIDAQSGEILKREDLIKEVNGSGKVFFPNPVKSSGNNALRSPKATSGSCGFAGASAATINAQQVTKTLNDLTLSGGVYRLEGPFCKIVDLAAPTIASPTEANPNAFNYGVGDNRFEPVNVYFHVDNIQRYIQSLGILNANNRQQPCDAHDDSTLAAWYSPVDKALHFSSSSPCRPDRGQDGMCMVHEYGHAIQDNQVPGWGGQNPVTHRDETDSMGEGFGDALACIYFAPDYPYQREIFEDWIFADNATHGLRLVNGTKTYPASWSGEVHSDGEIWSAALWNIYRTIGGDALSLADRHAARDAILKTVINSHHLVAANGTMPDGAEAIMTTHAESSEFRGKYLTQMLDSFHARQILLCDSRADLYIRDDTSDPGVDAFVGPVFWDSPDLWIRNADDNGTTHQNVVAGHDNYFYARVRNRGSATARAFVVTFNVKPWAGVQFFYPNDFKPFVSAAVGYNIPPGGSAIVKAKWPAALVPLAGTHACWLASVYTPTDITATGRHVWESNNLAQKNLTIVTASPDAVTTIQFQIGNLANLTTQRYRLEIRRPKQFVNMPISITYPDPAVVRSLFNSVNEVTVASKTAASAEITAQPQISHTVRFVDPARVEIAPVGVAVKPVSMRIAADSTLDLEASTALRREQPATMDQTLGAQLLTTANAAEISFNPGVLAGFPIALMARSQPELGLKFTIPKEAKLGDQFKIQVVQRDEKNKVVGGITVQVNVAPK